MAYTAKDPRPPPPTAFSVPNRNVPKRNKFLNVWKRRRRREEKVHLKTHAPLGGGWVKRGMNLD